MLQGLNSTSGYCIGQSVVTPVVTENPQESTGLELGSPTSPALHRLLLRTSSLRWFPRQSVFPCPLPSVLTPVYLVAPVFCILLCKLIKMTLPSEHKNI